MTPEAHDHAHGRHDHLAPARLGRAFALGLSLNVGFVALGIVAGLVANSTALLADVAHNLGDVLGIAMAWGAMMLARRARTARRTYGLRRTTIVAGVANAVLILFAIGGVCWEAIRRLGEAPPVDGGVVAAVAAVGVVVNGIAAMLFAKARDRDVNVRGVFLHLLSDAAVSAGVVVSGLIVWRTGWSWIDPATSLVVSVVILIGTLQLLREALDLLLDAVPAHIDPDAIERYLAALPGVCEVHDLHIWSMSTTEIALTAHLVAPGERWPPGALGETAEEIEHRFAIHHVTLQLEAPGHPEPCRLALEGSI